MIVRSPDGSIEAVVAALGADRRPTLEIRREGEPVLPPSPVGIRTDGRPSAGGRSIEEVGRAEIETRYELPAGKRRTGSHHANQLSVALTVDDGDRIGLDVRAANDGVAYRYRLPGSGPMLVTGEESGFRIPAGSAMWTAPIEAKHEGIFRETTIDEAAGRYDLLSLFEVGDAWMLVAESDVDGRYVTAHLEIPADGTLARIRFPDDDDHRMSEEPAEVSARRPLTTPWRVAVIGDLATVVESDLVAELAGDDRPGTAPARISDRSWIQAGRAAWSWWSDGASPADVDVQRSYVDYAAERGWEYVLVDEGWDAAWLPDLVAYADERDVGVFVWSRWSDLNTLEKREVHLSRWRSWGVAGVKVDFMNSDCQDMMAFYDDLAAATAERELLLNVHGSIPPKGLRRRWPNLLTYEGVHGAENYHPVPKTIPPEHNLILPYTRNVVGPMDYTPVTFSAETRQTTVGHELALAVVYESGLQHFADGIETYHEYPVAERFLERVPAAWDDVRFVGGRPGETAVLARRSGAEWFVAAVAAVDPGTIEVTLSFLEPDATYEATTIRDGADGESFVREESTVERGDVVAVDVPENGGFVVHLRPR